MIGSSHFYVGVSLVPQNTTAPSTGGDIRFNSSTNKLELYTTTLDPVVTEAGTATLTNKVLTGNTAVNLISGSGTLTLNTTGTITVPNATDTLVARNTTDTLTNKTLSGNTATNLISGSGTLTLNTTGTITVPNATDTLVGKATTDTLSNKTFSDAITVAQIATPSNPASGFNKLYAKSDNKLYILTSGGVESQVGSGTVTSVAASVPAFLSISGSPITTSGTLAITLSGTALPIANGGTGVTSVTTSPTATSFAGWDANKNLSANSFIQGYRTTATAAGTTTLVVGDTFEQFFTGSTTQTVLLPVTSTLVLGQQYFIVNNSSGVVTVQSSGANTIQAMAGSTSALFTVILTSGTGTASWSMTGYNATTGNQSANTVFAGPASGASAAPTFRTLVAADSPPAMALNVSYNSSSGSISANAVFKYDTTVFDTNSGWSVSTGLYTVPTGLGGKYLISFRGLGNATFNAYIKVNGTATDVLTTITNGVAGSGSAILSLSAGDTIGIYTDTTVTLTAKSGSVGYYNSFALVRTGS